METGHTCRLCQSADVQSIIDSTTAQTITNKAKRKAIYSELAMWIHPDAYARGRIVDLPACLIEMVRLRFSDKAYSNFKTLSAHMNR